MNRSLFQFDVRSGFRNLGLSHCSSFLFFILWQTKTSKQGGIHIGKLEESVLLIQWEWSRDEIFGPVDAMTCVRCSFYNALKCSTFARTTFSNFLQQVVVTCQIIDSHIQLNCFEKNFQRLWANMKPCTTNRLIPFCILLLIENFDVRYYLYVN